MRIGYQKELRETQCSIVPALRSGIAEDAVSSAFSGFAVSSTTLLGGLAKV